MSPSSAHLSYAIRDIVKFGEVVRQYGVEITWENIGDPIAKGERVEPWIRDIVHEVIETEGAWGYCPTEGFLDVRESSRGPRQRASREFASPPTTSSFSTGSPTRSRRSTGF